MQASPVLVPVVALLRRRFGADAPAPSAVQSTPNLVSSSAPQAPAKK